MTLGNFTAIMTEIIGTPSNDYESFIIYTFASMLGMFIILFVFQIFIIIADLIKIRQK